MQNNDIHPSLFSGLKMQITHLFRSKLILKNIIWNSLDAIVYPILLLIATPIFVEKIGLELYGIWMLVNTIMASVGILNAGLGDATIKFVSKYIAKKDLEGVNKVVGATYSIHLVLGAIVILVSSAIALLVRGGFIFHIANDYRLIACYSIVITGVTLSLKFTEQVFLAVFRGFDRYDVASKISILGKLFTVLVNIGLAYLNYSLTYILFSTCLTTVLFLIIETFLIRRFSGFNSFFPSYEKKYIREVFSFGIWSWIQSVIGILAGQVDKFIVISLSDLKTFAFYSIALTVFGQIHSCFAASVSWLFAIISKKIHNNEDIRSLYYRTQFYFLNGVTVILLVFFLVKDPIILAWLGKDVFNSTIHFIDLLIPYNLILAISIIPTYFLNASGHIRLTTAFSLSTLVARTICIPIFYFLFHTNGIVIGLVVSGLITMPVQIFLFNKRVLNIHDVFAGVKIIIPCLIFFHIYMQAGILLSFFALIAMVICYVLLLAPFSPIEKNSV